MSTITPPPAIMMLVEKQRFVKRFL